MSYALFSPETFCCDQIFEFPWVLYHSNVGMGLHTYGLRLVLNKISYGTNFDNTDFGKASGEKCSKYFANAQEYNAPYLENVYTDNLFYYGPGTSGTNSYLFRNCSGTLSTSGSRPIKTEMSIKLYKPSDFFSPSSSGSTHPNSGEYGYIWPARINYLKINSIWHSGTESGNKTLNFTYKGSCPSGVRYQSYLPESIGDYPPTCFWTPLRQSGYLCHKISGLTTPDVFGNPTFVPGTYAPNFPHPCSGSLGQSSNVTLCNSTKLRYQSENLKISSFIARRYIHNPMVSGDYISNLTLSSTFNRTTSGTLNKFGVIDKNDGTFTNNCFDVSSLNAGSGIIASFNSSGFPCQPTRTTKQDGELCFTLGRLNLNTAKYIYNQANVRQKNPTLAMIKYSAIKQTPDICPDFFTFPPGDLETYQHTDKGMNRGITISGSDTRHMLDTKIQKSEFTPLFNNPDVSGSNCYHCDVNIPMTCCTGTPPDFALDFSIQDTAESCSLWDKL